MANVISTDFIGNSIKYGGICYRLHQAWPLGVSDAYPYFNEIFTDCNTCEASPETTLCPTPTVTNSPSFTPTVTQTSTVGPTATFNPFTTPTQTPTPGIVYRRAVVGVVDSDGLRDGGGSFPVLGKTAFVGNGM